MKFAVDNRMVRWLCFLIFLISVHLTLVAEGHGTSAITNDEPTLRKIFAKQCRNIDSMRHLSDMKGLIETLRTMDKFPIDGTSNAGTIAVSWNEYLTLTPDPARPCLEQAPAILELEPIIDEMDDVCKSSHVDLLEAYKRKYLDGVPNHRVTKRFFNLYTNQVSFICKHNLMNSLQLANDKMFIKDNYDKVMPWLIEPPNGCPELANNELRSGQKEHEFDLDQFDAGTGRVISNETDLPALRCEAIRALSSVKSINELVEVMEKDFSGTSPESPTTDNITKRKSRLSNMMLIVPDNMRQTVERMLEACSQLEQIYSQTITPIVRLIQLGYNPTYRKFDERCRADILPQRWFSITLICHSMLRSRLADQKSQSEFKKDLADNRTGLIVVDDQIIHREPTKESNDQLSFKNPIEDELWVGKYIPSRFKRFRTRYISNLLRLFKIDKLCNNVVFRKNVKRARSIIVTLIFAGLTLLGINSSNFL